MRLLFGIPLNQARYILGTALEEISARPELWNALLNNGTDHHWVTPFMLGRFCQSGQFKVRAAPLPEAPLKGLANGLSDASDEELRHWLGLGTQSWLDLDDLDPSALYRPDVEFGSANHAQPGSRVWSAATLWPLLRRWLPARKFMGVFGRGQKQQRCLILRFHRYLPYQPIPLVSHWSTGQDFSKDILNLFDCTANKEAVHSLPLNETALYPEELDKHRLLALEPQSLWFIEKI